MALPVATAPRPRTDPRIADRRESGGSRPGHRRWLVPVCAAVVMVLYATSAVLFARDGSGSDFHRRQAAAIAAGHLDIRPVPAALRALPDPYDAEANLRTRIDDGVQDLAYRNGRLYSAHGMTLPVLLAPAELVFGTAPPNWVITLVAGWVGVAAGAWTISRLRRRFAPTLPDRATASLVLAFGLCGPVWTSMAVGNGYEAAIATAFAFTMCGIAFLLRATDDWPDLRRVSAAAGSTCLALAVGARPTAAVGVIAVGVLAVMLLRRELRSGLRTVRIFTDLATAVVPFAVVVLALAWANLKRFGSPVEFGFGYQLSVWNMTTYPIGRGGYVVSNLVDYLAAAPRLAGSFPWVRERATIAGNRPEMHTSEPIVGLIFAAPVLVVGLACLVAGFRDMRRRAPRLAVYASSVAAMGFAALVAVSFPFNTSTMRYAADGAPLLLLAACTGWGWARVGSGNRRRTRLLDTTWLATLCVGIVVTALVQIPT